jgi:hypothetical protein
LPKRESFVRRKLESNSKDRPGNEMPRSTQQERRRRRESQKPGLPLTKPPLTRLPLTKPLLIGPRQKELRSISLLLKRLKPPQRKPLQRRLPRKPKRRE